MYRILVEKNRLFVEVLNLRTCDIMYYIHINMALKNDNVPLVILKCWIV